MWSVLICVVYVSVYIHLSVSLCICVCLYVCVLGAGVWVASVQRRQDKNAAKGLSALPLIWTQESRMAEGS